MLVLNKPAGIPVHRGPKGGDFLEGHFEALRFGLPKFIEKAPGEIEGAEVRLAQAMACQTPTWRRRGATLANRRPGGLLRRSARLICWRRDASDRGFSPAIPAS